MSACINTPESDDTEDPANTYTQTASTGSSDLRNTCGVGQGDILHVPIVLPDLLATGEKESRLHPQPPS